MIVKASQRTGGAQLAAHLLNTRDNEFVEVAELRGLMAEDLTAACAEIEAQARGTRCQKPFYHLVISPDQTQGCWSREQYDEFIGRVEQELGLADYARAIVYHAKKGKEHYRDEGRQHGHVIWSRIDTDTGKAAQIYNDHPRLMRLAADFARDYGLHLPPGFEQQPEGEEQRRPKAKTVAEQKQQERSGLTKAERVAILTGAWQEHPEAGAFVEALQRVGFTLARGDGQQRKAGKVSQPVYVVLDAAGEVHSLARQIEGAKAKEIAARLADGYALGSLESVEAVRAKQEREERQRQQQQRAVGKEFNYAAGRDFAREVISPPPSAKQQDYTAGRDFARDETQPPTIDRDRQEAAWQDAVDKAGIAYVEQRRQQLRQTQGTERATYEGHREEMTARHSATWGEAVHRHAVEMAEAYSVAPASYQPGTMEDAGQAAATGFSAVFGFLSSIMGGITGSTRRRAGRDSQSKPAKRDTERREQEKRDQHRQEMSAIMEQQAHERESFERRHTAMLQDQQRAREHFEQNYADPSAMQQAFDIHGRQTGNSYAAELGRMAAQKEARQERERGGPEFEGPELKP